MKNKILRLSGSHKSEMEFFCVDTNDVNPYRPIKEGGIVVLQDDIQLDFDLDEEELTELIDFLTEMRDHVAKFNSESKPIEILNYDTPNR